MSKNYLLTARSASTLQQTGDADGLCKLCGVFSESADLTVQAKFDSEKPLLPQ